MKKIIVALALMVSACGLFNGKAAVPVAIDVTNAAVETLVNVQRQTELDCVNNNSTRAAAQACIDSTAAKFAPVWAAYDKMRLAGFAVSDFCVLAQEAETVVGVKLPYADQLCADLNGG